MNDKQCERCGEVNPAEIHTCSPNYVDRRQWKYDPMTGEPLIDGWPLYSGLPEPEPVAWMTHHEPPMIFSTRSEALLYCDEDEVPVPLYTTPPQREFTELELMEIRPGPIEIVRREWQGLTDEEAEHIYAEYWNDVVMFIEAIENVLRRKNS